MLNLNRQKFKIQEDIMSTFYVTLDKFVKRHHLEVIYVPAEMTEIKITSKEVNRPGLLLSGYSEFFDP